MSTRWIFCWILWEFLIRVRRFWENFQTLVLLLGFLKLLEETLDLNKKVEDSGSVNNKCVWLPDFAVVRTLAVQKVSSIISPKVRPGVMNTVLEFRLVVSCGKELQTYRSSSPDVSLQANNRCCSIRNLRFKYFDSSGRFFAVMMNWMTNDTWSELYNRLEWATTNLEYILWKPDLLTMQRSKQYQQHLWDPWYRNSLYGGIYYGGQ
jgi:hypothetical protein